jgi:antitoxin (DNA-binding transcriptional repressor) of toxin-antitoxin stability system
MRFLSIRELRTSTSEIKDILTDDGKIVVTIGGKPAAFMVAIDEESFEQTLEDWRQVRGLRAFRELQFQARENGLSGMTLDDINAEIAASRAEREQSADVAGVR